VSAESGSAIEDTPVLDNSRFYEEAMVHGMGVSPEGFCVFLRGVVCDRVLRVLITPGDPMADGLDRDQVTTTEAVTLLQLLQGIDVESHLAPDALNSKFVDATGAKKPYSLVRVMVDMALNRPPYKFSARLCGSVKGSEQIAPIIFEAPPSFDTTMSSDLSSTISSSSLLSESLTSQIVSDTLTSSDPHFQSSSSHSTSSSAHIQSTSSTDSNFVTENLHQVKCMQQLHLQWHRQF
jgi:hypothetical protein